MVIRIYVDILKFFGRKFLKITLLFEYFKCSNSVAISRKKCIILTDAFFQKMRANFKNHLIHKSYMYIYLDFLKIWDVVHYIPIDNIIFTKKYYISFFDDVTNDI